MLITVIVPVYNTGKYIEKCVISLINQTYSNIEILLIDDGSTDDSAKECKKLLSLDKRISYYLKENGGLADARNFGLKLASGEYVIFLDSDDWFEKDLIMNYYNLLNQNHLDVVVQGFTIELEVENSIVYNKMNEEQIFKEKIYDGIIALEEKGLFNSACNKIYKLSIIKDNEIYFKKDGMPAEDLLFNCEYFTFIKSMAYIPSCSYHYIKREVETLTTKYIIDYDKKIMDYHKARKKMYLMLNIDDADRIILLNNSLSFYVLTVFTNIYRYNCPLSKKEKINIIKDVLNNQEALDSIFNNTLNNLFINILKLLFKTKSPSLIYSILKILFTIRYKFNNIYRFIRRKVLYGR